MSNPYRVCFRISTRPGISWWNRRKGSGVVFGQACYHMVDPWPKTTPDPLGLTPAGATVIGKQLLAGCLFAVLLMTTGISAVRLEARDASTDEPEALQRAGQIVQASGRLGGICVILGARDADLALAVGRQGNFVVHVLADTDELCHRLRQQIRAEGRYGMISAAVHDGQRLPYADRLINLLIVADGAGPHVDLRELARVVAPLGTVFWAGQPQNLRGQESAAVRDSGLETVPSDLGDGWLVLRKPWPAGIDHWTHYLHGPDGNPVARDREVGPPRHYQWINGPLFQRSHETVSSISTQVSANGRLFSIVDQAPISLTGQHDLPDQWFLTARDAFNGVDLWQVPIRRWGWREWRDTWFSHRAGDWPLNLQKRLVAVGDHVYVTLGYHAPVSQLDARSGEILQTYEGTQRTNEILVLDGELILSVLVGDRVQVMAVDAATGQQRWVTRATYEGTTVDYIKWSGQGGSTPAAKLDPALNIATDGQVIALIDGPEIVCLSRATGELQWRVPFPSAESDLTAGGIRSQGNLWNGTMIVYDGVVLHASPGKLAAFATADGRLLWEQPKRFIQHLWYAWKDVFVIDGLVWTWSDQMDELEFERGSQRPQRVLAPRTANGYDLKTGRLVREVALGPVFHTHHHHRCYRNKATERYILASRRGTEYIDLEDGQHTVHNWVRGTCHVGMMPANGLQYAPPHPCQCYIDEKLNGMNALAPARPDTQPTDDEGPILVHGPAFQTVQASPPAQWHPQDWPTFRGDPSRTGFGGTSVPDQAVELWSVRAGANVSAPVVADGKVFAALPDQHHVIALDASDGRLVWEVAAGARIDSPPTYHGGTVIFGSADGWVTCVRAEAGQVVWRFRAAPRDRLIGAFGQLESAWPVSGSVLVQDGIAYFAAGRTSQLDGGITLYGLDARSGELRCRNRLAGPDYQVGDFETNYGLPMGTLPDVLIGDGTHVRMRNETFDADLQPIRGRSRLDLRTGSGLLEGTYFKRMPWVAEGEYARLIARDEQSVYYVRMFDSLRGLDPTVFFTPGRNGYLLFARSADRRGTGWTQRIAVRVRAMAVTDGRLFAAGPPDVVDPKDPLGAFEGRQGGILVAIDSGTGEHVAEHRLGSPPVFQGIAAARGSLYLALEDGRVVAYGQREK
jgi:outer membrane protein assembly factor BamB